MRYCVTSEEGEMSYGIRRKDLERALNVQLRSGHKKWNVCDDLLAGH
jgi:hypothetical protein